MTNNIYTCDICQEQFFNFHALAGHKHSHSQKWIIKRNNKKLEYKNYIDIQSDLFLNNKYTKIYYQIIKNARNKNYTGYTEKHHIIPKSLGGSNKWNNLIVLSTKEHFLCHYLLTKMIDMKSKYYHKMLNAFLLMKGNPNKETERYINSRLYNSVKSFHSKIQSNKVTGKNNPNYGKTYVTNWKTKTCIKIDISELNQYLSNGWQKYKITNFDDYIFYNNKIIHKTKYKKINKPRKEKSLINKLHLSRKQLVSEYYSINIEDLTEDHLYHYKDELHNYIWIYNLTLPEIMNLIHPTCNIFPNDYFKSFKIKTRTCKENGLLLKNRKNLNQKF